MLTAPFETQGKRALECWPHGLLRNPTRMLIPGDDPERGIGPTLKDEGRGTRKTEKQIPRAKEVNTAALREGAKGGR